MSNEQLKNALKELHRQLESAGAAVDDELKNLLKVLDSDIDQVLQQQAPARQDDDDSLASRSQELAARFAAQHPQMERMLRELGRTLENMGI